VQSLGEKFDAAAQSPLNTVTIPDLWQQQAVSALRAGKDVVVQSPTGAGKTLVFEAWSNQGRPKGQAIYTVPTRALANDKLAEWRARGWNVGIATGDLAENLDAPVLVATLETQKNRLIRGDGPTLLVIDEYQMLGDEDRGLNYELAMALAPAQTQLLLLSGSVANPHHIVKWFQRLGREAVLVRHEVRPVPLEEVFINDLSYHLPNEIRSHWARVSAKALAEGLGPVLLFAPRRQSAESIAAELARQLPNPNPLNLTEEQKHLVGPHLAQLLKARVAYHHSGLSYAARAGVIEPLAKAGQLRVVVATMGLAAGINFSLRSVAVTAHSFKRDGQEVPIRPDEILQMFGRAGRRGLDETGYALVDPDQLRMRDGQPAHLARSNMVDWSALLGLMHAAAALGRRPFHEAVRVQERLFTTKPIVLGVESSLKHPDVPCGLHTDAERARHVRRKTREMLNSRGEWERFPAPVDRRLADIRVPRYAQQPVAEAVSADEPAAPPTFAVTLVPLLQDRQSLERIEKEELISLASGDFGRAVKVAERFGDDGIQLSRWIRRITNWHGRETRLEVWRELVVPLVERAFRELKQPVVRFIEEPEQVLALISLGEQSVSVPVDRHGVALFKPRERDVPTEDCAGCALKVTCRALTSAAGTALLWRRLQLVEADGRPTRRGRLVSFFTGSAGLAVAAALEDATYPLDELIYDLANLDAGFRFSGYDGRCGGRLAVACRQAFGNLNVTGYLENGLPGKYGAGAESVVQAVHKNPMNKHRFVTEFLGDGDIDRVIIEWRSLLRQIVHSPELDWDRWTALQRLAKTTLNETESPTLTELPRLEVGQTRRVDHQLRFRRH
jgi:superfamily II DNA/RNA helicase